MSYNGLFSSQGVVLGLIVRVSRAREACCKGAYRSSRSNCEEKVGKKVITGHFKRSVWFVEVKCVS